MISRRQLLTASVATTLPGFGSIAHAGEAPLVEGKDFTVVRPTVALPARPIVIHDFFAYTCPHCQTFAPNVERLARQLAETRKDVQVVPVPVAWTADYELFPRTYYTFEALGLLEKLHMPFWDWVLKENHEWRSIQDVERDIINWAVKHGVDAKEFRRTLFSFTVSSKCQQAAKMWKSYGVDSTPSLGVHGRFLTSPHMAGSRGRSIHTAKVLLDRVTKGE